LSNRFFFPNNAPLSPLGGGFPWFCPENSSLSFKSDVAWRPPPPPPPPPPPNHLLSLPFPMGAYSPPKPPRLLTSPEGPRKRPIASPASFRRIKMDELPAFCLASPDLSLYVVPVIFKHHVPSLFYSR